MKNGEWVQNQEGEPDVWKGHWEIVKGEIRLTHTEPKEWDSMTKILRINSDGSVSQIAWLIEGKRTDTPEDKLPNYKKLN